MSADDRIVAKVAVRAADRLLRADMDSPPDPVPLAGTSLLDRIEAELGFALPGLLKRLYCEVGDGGFGPGYGLIGAAGHWMDDTPGTLADWYRASHQGEWPAGLVPICEWGCAIRSCVQCLAPGLPMVLADPSRGPVEFTPEGLGFAEWIDAWADGVDLWERWMQLPPQEAQPRDVPDPAV